MSTSPVSQGPSPLPPSKPVERVKAPPQQPPPEKEEEVSSSAGDTREQDSQSVRGRVVDISA